jgi:hypothetical protein
MLDESAPAGLQNYWKSAFLATLGDAAMDVLVKQAAAMRSPLAALHIHHLQSAVGRLPADGTAFGHRDAGFVLNIVGTWPDPADLAANVDWVRSTSDAIAAHSAAAPYINFMGDEASERVRVSVRSGRAGRSHDSRGVPTSLRSKDGSERQARGSVTYNFFAILCAEVCSLCVSAGSACGPFRFSVSLVLCC